MIESGGHLYGGQLEAFSAGPHQGSEFTVRLPALPEGESVKPEQASAETNTSLSARRILLVEDEEAVADAGGATLGPGPYGADSLLRRSDF
ncbi:hypothetical protein [Nitrosococcus wardiae]|uniref:hypothetical protein n=1 Tax=Nitrosococcus wardiae TaxID=1814290 RepID=UPI001F102124|nr:hypothetical protein [Nitrosococcus wardiae]